MIEKIEGRQFLYCIVILLIYWGVWLLMKEINLLEPIILILCVLSLVSIIINIVIVIIDMIKYRKENDYYNKREVLQDEIDNEYNKLYYNNYLMLLPRMLTIPFWVINFFKITNYITKQTISWFDNNLTIKIK